MAKNILVKDGGPWRVRDRTWANGPQNMVTEEGWQKDYEQYSMREE